jgi:hypothetical protein
MGMVWDKDLVVDCFKEFFPNPCLKHLCTLPTLVSWGIWLARNTCLFEEKFWPPFKVAQQSISLFD